MSEQFLWMALVGNFLFDFCMLASVFYLLKTNKCISIQFDCQMKMIDILKRRLDLFEKQNDKQNLIP